MNRRAYLVLMAGLLLAPGFQIAMADSPPPAPSGTAAPMKGQWVERRVQHLTEKLGLNAQQKTQLEGILKSEAEQMKPLHEQMKTIHQQTDEKIKGILTADQKKTFEEMRAKRREMMEKHMGQGMGPMHGGQGGDGEQPPEKE